MPFVEGYSEQGGTICVLENKNARHISSLSQACKDSRKTLSGFHEISVDWLIEPSLTADVPVDCADFKHGVVALCNTKDNHEIDIEVVEKNGCAIIVSLSKYLQLNHLINCTWT